MRNDIESLKAYVTHVAKFPSDYSQSQKEESVLEILNRLDRNITKLKATNMAYREALERPVVININGTEFPKQDEEVIHV